MANILIAVATLIIGFILAGYGAYNGYFATKRSEYTMRVSSAFEHILTDVIQLRNDMGEVPPVAYVAASRIQQHNFKGITYSYSTSGGQGYVCALSSRNDFVDAAFQAVAEQRSGALLGSTCNTSGGPSASSVSVTVRIN